MRRRLAFLLFAILGSLFAGVFVTPSTASAIGLDCRESPTPEVPGRGLTGFFQSEPKQLPPQEDPFAPNAKTTIYEQYGYAGLRWTTYDLGCGPDSARAPDATAGTAVANWLFLVPKAAVAFTNAVIEVALRPTFLGEFDPLVSNVSDVLYRTLFSNWVPLVLLATGALLIWRARRANLASSTAAVGWAAFIMVVATALFQWPVEAGRAADASVTTTLTVVNGGLARSGGVSQTASEKAAASNTHQSLLYQAWLAGTFGESESDTASIYGPQLFDATALTWREAQILRQDPVRGKSIVDDKRKKFADVAQKVKDADPDAYEYLTGKRSETRVGYALLAICGALFALPFLLGAFLVVLASFLVIRFAVMLFPAFATLAVFPAMRGVVTAVGSLVAAALINGVIFGVAAVVVLRGVGLLLDPQSPLPRWLSLTLMLLVSVVMWVVLRPVRRIGSVIVSGADRVVDRAERVSEEAAAAGRRGRHARTQESRRPEQQWSTAGEELRSEIHTIAESQTIARWPGTSRLKEPEPPPALPPGTVPAGTPTTRGSEGDGVPVPGRTPPSPTSNGKSAAASEANPLQEPVREAGGRSVRPPPTSTQGDPGALPGSRGRRPAGGDGASAPLNTPLTAEESRGPIYVPGRNSVAKTGGGIEADPLRMEEATGPVYRPAGKGREPTRPGE